MVEYSTTAEWIAQQIDKTARSTCILELSALLVVEYLRHDNSNIVVAFQLLHKRCQPPLRRLDIGVEQDEGFVALELRQGTIVALGKASCD